MFSFLVEAFLFGIILFSLTVLLGKYMANIFTDKPMFIHRILGWLEKLTYRIIGINPELEMSWIEYGKSLLFINILGFFFLFIFLQIQEFLPLNPQHFKGVPWSLAFNIAASFTTNTDWQSYSGETTLSYFAQMVGLTSQNFLSAATGMAVLLTLIRGLIRRGVHSVGNFYVDLVRMVVYILLPLSIMLALVLANEGVIQNFSAYKEVNTLENHTQIIPLGPVASQVAIKILGTNGGGFFNANGSHPFENPTRLSNFIQMFALLLIPAASVYMYGILIGSKKQAWLLFLTIITLCLFGIAVSLWSENLINPVVDAFPNMEGKETRFGVSNSLFWMISTTASANGSVNSMFSSLSPLAGGMAMFNIMLGELVFGGTGVGLCSMIMLTILTVFLAGLMVGRTPEYLGKKIEKEEVQWVALAVLTPGAIILCGAGLTVLFPQVVKNIINLGPHGLSEVLFAFSSSVANNGSAFAGLKSNTLYFNLVLGIVMIIGRMAIVVPSLALAGLLAKKNISPPSSGTFSTNSFLFFVLLMSVIFIVGALTFFPALSLGPIVEHFLMLRGESF